MLVFNKRSAYQYKFGCYFYRKWNGGSTLDLPVWGWSSDFRLCSSGLPALQERENSVSTSNSKIELLLEIRIMLTCTVNLPLIITDIHVNVLLCPHLMRAWESCWSVSTHCRVTNLLLNCIAEMNRFDLLSNYFCSTIEFKKYNFSCF